MYTPYSRLCTTILGLHACSSLPDIAFVVHPSLCVPFHFLFKRCGCILLHPTEKASPLVVAHASYQSGTQVPCKLSVSVELVPICRQATPRCLSGASSAAASSSHVEQHAHSCSCASTLRWHPQPGKHALGAHRMPSAAAPGRNACRESRRRPALAALPLQRKRVGRW